MSFVALFHSHGQSEVAVRKGKSRVDKSKHKSSVERGSGHTAKRNTSKVPFPSPILASEDTSHTLYSENLPKASNGVQHPVKTEEGNEV